MCNREEKPNPDIKPPEYTVVTEGFDPPGVKKVLAKMKRRFFPESHVNEGLPTSPRPAIPPAGMGRSPIAKMERPAPWPDPPAQKRPYPVIIPDGFNDMADLMKPALTLEDLDLLSTLVLQKLNSMLARGVYHPMELLEVDPADFHAVHASEAAKLQRLGEKLCRLSLTS